MFDQVELRYYFMTGIQQEGGGSERLVTRCGAGLRGIDPDDNHGLCTIGAQCDHLLRLARSQVGTALLLDADAATAVSQSQRRQPGGCFSSAADDLHAAR